MKLLVTCSKVCLRVCLAVLAIVCLLAISALFPHFQTPDSSLVEPQQFLSLELFPLNSHFVKVPLYTNTVNISVIVSGNIREPYSTVPYTCPKGVVMLLHGFPDTPLTFHHQANHLVSKGYCTLAPFLRGFEGSSLNNSYYSMDLDSDVLEIMTAFHVHQAHLVGHDWGAGIAYRLAAHIPSRILSVTGMAIPWVWFANDFVHEPKMSTNSRYTVFFQFAFLSNWLAARSDFQYISQLWAKWSPNTNWTSDPSLNAIKEVYRRGHPHTLWASLAFYRQNMPTRFYPISIMTMHQRNIKTYGLRTRQLTHTPVQVLYGEDDGCADRYGFEGHEFNGFFPADYFRQHGFPAAGHFMHLEAPSQVNAHISDWIEKHAHRQPPTNVDTFNYSTRTFCGNYPPAPFVTLSDKHLDSSTHFDTKHNDL